MATGTFIDSPLIYNDKKNDGGLTNDQQAIAILKKAKQLLAAGFPVVAITYSATESQTRALVKAYAAGNYMAGIDGANQAQVMNAMEAHLGGQDWKELQMKVRIAPITTMRTYGPTVLGTTTIQTTCPDGKHGPCHGPAEGAEAVPRVV